jgi:hypothetical protein
LQVQKYWRIVFGMKTPDRELTFRVRWGNGYETDFPTRDFAKVFCDARNGRMTFRSRFWARKWQDCTDNSAWAEFEQQMFDWEDELRRKREER